MKKYLCLICVFALLIVSLVGCKKADDKTSYNKKDLQQVQKEDLFYYMKFYHLLSYIQLN